MAAGNGRERLLVVMHNDFVIVGPPTTRPAIQRRRDAVEALQRIAAARRAVRLAAATTPARTARAELWEDGRRRAAGRPGTWSPARAWAQTLTIADDSGAYTIADRGTYLAHGHPAT